MRRCVGCGRPSPARSLGCEHCGHVPATIDGFPVFAPECAAGGDGFERHYFPDLAEVEERYFWFRCRARLVLDTVRQHFADARSLLEVGCGNGFNLLALRRALPGVELWGSDVFVEGLRLAAARVPDARLVQLDVRRVPFEEEFDVICALDVLEHVTEDELALRQLCRALRRGGGLVVTVPQHPGLWSATDEYARHKRRYSRHELVAKVERAGFEVRRVTSFVTLLLPVMWLGRKWRGTPVGGSDPMAEVRIPRWLDGALGAVLELERWLIGRGLSLPAGGSLLLVARRAPGEAG